MQIIRGLASHCNAAALGWMLVLPVAVAGHCRLSTVRHDQPDDLANLQAIKPFVALVSCLRRWGRLEIDLDIPDVKRLLTDRERLVEQIKANRLAQRGAELF
jgi:hypothetical protein